MDRCMDGWIDIFGNSILKANVESVGDRHCLLEVVVGGGGGGVVTSCDPH